MPTSIQNIFINSSKQFLSLNPNLKLSKRYDLLKNNKTAGSESKDSMIKSSTANSSHNNVNSKLSLVKDSESSGKKEIVSELERIFEKSVEPITFNGWIRTARHQKRFSFVSVNDGSSFNDIQIVVPKELIDKFDKNMVGTGTSVEIKGKLSLNPKLGKILEDSDKVIDLSEVIEVQALDFKVIGNCDQNEYPLQKKYHTVEFLREKMHLRPRTKLISSAMRIRSSVSNSIHNFFADEGFFLLHTPLITGLDCEGGGEQFHVSVDESRLKLLDNSHGKSFFGDSCPDPRLTVSGQLEAEMFASGGLSKVYTFGPTFRAENSNTTRHLAEFWMVEPEAAFMDLNDIQNLSEKCVKHVIKDILNKHPEEIAFFEKRLVDGLNEKMISTNVQNSRISTSIVKELETTLNSTFVRMTFQEAEKILLEKQIRKMKYSESGNNSELGGLSTEEERYLTEIYCNGVPVFVTGFPKSCKSFYMRVNDRSEKSEYDTVGAMDLLVPRIGELIGGSEREERYDVLKQRMEKDGLLKTKSLDWYLDLRRFGTVPHAGFGMGLERLILFITGIENIRDVIPVPRFPGFCRF